MYMVQTRKFVTNLYTLHVVSAEMETFLGNYSSHILNRSDKSLPAAISFSPMMMDFRYLAQVAVNTCQMGFILSVSDSLYFRVYIWGKSPLTLYLVNEELDNTVNSLWYNSSHPQIETYYTFGKL